MSTFQALKSSLSRLQKDRRGNFGMVTAVLLPLAIGAGALAVDITNAAMAKHQLQEASDAAALATAAALADGKIDTTTASSFAKDFVAGQMANFIGDTTELRDTTTATVTKTTSNGATSYSVSVASSYSMELSGLAQVIGFNTTNIGAASKTASGHSEKQGSVSIFLALDKSGSMGNDTGTVNASQPTESYTYECGGYLNKHGKWITQTCTGTRTNYYTKIEALKLAVGNLTAELDKADPTHIYSRTGAVAYDIKTYPETALAWGTSEVTTYVNALMAANGTNSSGAMDKAYTSLTALNNARNDNENALHQAKTGQTPKKYIVFMTDGDNNDDLAGGRSYDILTKGTCDTAKSKGIEIYTIAFMAPENGQALLKYCATDDNHYFKAESMSDLLAAFQEIGAKTSSQTTRLIN
ncbi:vWA domain-containing protein [Rhizobium mesoamericanum]|uniref:vWA domain-containing protein n=1 Tax=Rhizobium mesoamericanum TaxID=1079800 RepID=UPI00049084C5|nr:pilus assembly protein [Rhizobium mesoamericanum]